MNKQEPISDDSRAKNSGCGRVAATLFGLMFVTIGSWGFYSNGLNPLLQKQRSANWPTVKCKILKAETERHQGEDSTRYSIDFSYTYKVNDQVYYGNRYSFADAKTRRKETKRQQEAFPVGSSRECFYNPQKPSECVLDRTNQDQAWFDFLGPLIFVVIGGVVMIVALFFGSPQDKESISGAIKAKSAKSDHFKNDTDAAMPEINALTSPLGGSKVTLDHPADQRDAQWAGPLKLKPVESRWKQVAVLGAITLFWNGLVATFIFGSDFVQNFGWAQIGVELFMLPFVLVGLLLVFGTIYWVIAVFNPTVEIALSRGAVPLGGTVDIAWQIKGRFERIKKLTIHVQALQQATNSRGSTTTTIKEVFEKLLVTESTDIADVAFGSTSVTIPADSMHTFHAQRNQIKWQVRVYGDISWSPDILEIYDFRVTPIKTESRSS